MAINRSFSILTALALVTPLTACQGPSAGDTAVTEALPDTEENRMVAAERYLKAQPMEPMMRETAEKMAAQMPPDARQMFKDAMMNELDIPKVEELTKKAMAKNFTLSEINAMADFYGSPEGTSVMKKFPQYMADLMPTVQQETMAAMQKAMTKVGEAQQAGQQPGAPGAMPAAPAGQ